MAIRILCVFLTLLIASSCQKPTKQELPVIVEQEISSGKLKASYINAGNNSPVILIVPGSGPTDRDGNSGLGLKSNAYKHLAEQLLGYNISTIRVDKRGMFGSSAAGDGNAVTVDIYAQDYRSWIDKIKEMTGANCVYLLGHSEGGIMVSAAAAGRDDVCGLILVAAPGRSFGNILREQLRANPANKPILEQAFGAIEKLEAGENVDTAKLHPALAGLFYPDVQGYLISLMSVDPAKLAADANQRTLVIQGKNDIQVLLKDAELIYAQTGGTLVLLDGVNHILKITPTDRAGNIATYNKPDLPVAESVISAIRGFVSR